MDLFFLTCFCQFFFSLVVKYLITMKKILTTISIVFSCYYTAISQEGIVYQQQQDVFSRTLSKNPEAVYTLPGKISINNGQAGYTIPLDIPKGVNGMEPDLSISYASARKNGILGVGWNVNTIRAITRANGSYVFDGNHSRVKLEDSDELSLNGVRLILKSGSNMTQGAIYTTSTEVYSKIEFTGTGFEITTSEGEKLYYGTNSSHQLLVKDANNVHQPYKWFLEKEEGRNGNYIEYDYSIDAAPYNNDAYLTKITYTKNETLPNVKLAEIDFTYATRTDLSSGYRYGEPFRETKLLEQIETKFDNTTYTTYELKYSFDSNNDFSRLVEIDFQKRGSTVNPTIINWFAPAQDHIVNTNYTFEFELGPLVTPHPLGNDLSAAGQALPMDINGDGKMDILTLEYKIVNDGTCNHWGLSNPIYKHEYTVKSNILDGTDFIQATIVQPFFSQWKPDECKRERFAKIYTGDFNGDGLMDFALHKAFIHNANLNRYVFDFYINDASNPGSFTMSKSIMPIDHLPDDYFDRANRDHDDYYNEEPGQHSYSVIVADFDADGITDFAYTSTGGGDSYTQSSFNTPPYTRVTFFNSDLTTYSKYAWHGNGTVDEASIGDFNGDGKVDIMYVEKQGSVVYSCVDRDTWEEIFTSNQFPSEYHHPFFGDFNGDGLTDVLVNHPTFHDWSITYSHGTDLVGSHDATIDNIIQENIPFEFEPGLSLPLRVDVPNTKYPHIEDIDLDGRDDIIIPVLGDRQDLKIHVYYNKITGWEDEWIYPYGNPTPSNLSSWYNFRSFQEVVWGDFLGAGTPQMFVTTALLPDVSGSFRPSFLVSFRQGDKSKYVNHILDGFNRLTTFDYGRMSDNSVYTRSSIYSYPSPSYEAPLTVAKSAIQKDFNGNIFLNESYTYTNLRANLRGLGALGFEKIERTDNINGYVYTQNMGLVYDPGYAANHISWPLLPTTNTVKHSNGTTLSEHTNLYKESELYNQLSNGNFNFTILLGFSRNKDFLAQISASKKFTYDIDGNVIEERNRVFSNITLQLPALEEEFLYFSSFVNNGSWKAWLPQTVTRTNERDGEALITVITNYVYDQDGNPTQSTVYPNTTNELITDYVYSPEGNLTSKTVTPYNLLARSELTQWDSDQRFITKTTNPMGWETDFTRESIKGEVLSMTDYNGLNTTISYDDFDREISRTNPDGNNVTTEYKWNLNTGYPESLFFTRESGTNRNKLRTWYDGQSRIIKKGKQDQAGSWVYINTEYITSKDLIYRESNPYSGSSPTDWTTYGYDTYNRVNSRVSPATSFSYTFNAQTTTTTNTSASPNRVKSETLDATGKLISATDDGGTISYQYDSWGNTLQVQGPSATISMTYDSFGRQIELNDPASGITSYEYDALNRLTSQEDSRTNTYTMSYDKIDRVISKIGSEGTYSFSYDNTFKGALDNVTSPFNNLINYAHDNLGRTVAIIHQIDGQDYEFLYEYGSNGKLQYMTYPNGFRLNYTYNTEGFLEKITDFNGGRPIWEYGVENHFGQLTEYDLGNTTWSESFDIANALPTGLSASGAWEFSYDVNPSTGNLSSRGDLLKGLNENFEYDNLDRLTDYGIGTGLTVEYDSDGNITSKDDVGEYTNSSVTGRTSNIEVNPNTISTQDQTITYNEFNSVSTISEMDVPNGILYNASFVYGTDQQRRKMTITANGNVEIERLYVGNGLYERDFRDGQWKNYCYINLPTGKALLVTDEDTEENDLYFIVSDFQGSALALTDESGGSIVEEYSYDAWGNRRNVSTWVNEYNPGQNGNTFSGILYRGYTGHEHLEHFGLINMNGRLYDPLVGRMLSPDNNIQLPNFTQNLNRYSYALNNPTKYTDPDGEFAWVPMVIGAAIGAYQGYQIANAQGYEGQEMFGLILGGAIIGGMAGGMAGSITSSMGASATTRFGGLIASAVGTSAGGAFNSFGMTALAGGNPDDIGEATLKGAIEGFAGGVVGSWVAGRAGAFLGGATAGLVGSALNDLDEEDAIENTLFSALMALGSYELQQVSAYANYKKNGGPWNYKIWSAASLAAQKSFARGVEQGFWILADGTIEWWPSGVRDGIRPTPRPSNVIGSVHTHPNQGPHPSGGEWGEAHSAPDRRFAQGNEEMHVLGRQNVWYYDHTSPYSAITNPNPNPNIAFPGTHSNFNAYPYYSSGRTTLRIAR